MTAALQRRAARPCLPVRPGPVAIGLVLLVLSPAVVTAAALGGVTSEQTSAWASASSTGAPAVLVWENFDAPDASAIAGTTTDGGGRTWTLLAGSWSVTSNKARAGSAENNLVVDSGVTNATIEVDLERVGTSFDAGITINSNSTGSAFFDVEWVSGSNGSLDLWRFDGAWQLMASVTNLYPGGVATAPTEITLRVETDATTIRTYIDGVLQLSHTLSPADQVTFKSAGHDHFGLFTYGDTTSRFDDFHIDA